MSGGPELGDNPALRTLFFRLCTLAQWPLIPLFVFDGRNRPKVKRGSKMGKSGSLPLAQPMKTMLGHFGMEWREAEGEAEAELACLNQEGHIDVIITDDCDAATALIFGGKTIIRNSSLDLSGNKSNPALDKNGKESKHHVMVYTLLLFALLAGGDYHSGIPKMGPITARDLARCGFGDRLLDAFERFNEHQLKRFLVGWRAEINDELRTNSRGCLKQQRASLSLPADFPDYQVLCNYAAPICSRNVGSRNIRDNGELNIPALAGLCEEKFLEWGYRAAIIKRFRTLLWRPAVMHVLRRAALLADAQEREGVPYASEAAGTPAALVRTSLGFIDRAARYASAFVNQSDRFERGTVPDPHPSIMCIVGARNHVSTDEMLEFRVEVCPRQLVALAESGIKGTRRAPPGEAERERSLKKPAPEPESTLRMWIPGVMLQRIHPDLVEEYLESKTKKGKAPQEDEDENAPQESDSDAGCSPSRGKGKQTARPVLDDDRDEDSTLSSQQRTMRRRSTPEEVGAQLDWRAEIDHMLAIAPMKKRKKKRGAASDVEDPESKKRRVSAASFAKALRHSPPGDDIIDPTSD
ncbi:hypothetical protein K438DRAFT_1982730 [Mycena galopus ATCC 62051]|nr:hypothetical protein K438DRAFT_1982730 [Mycena galopus ATCC 62051]